MKVYPQAGIDRLFFGMTMPEVRHAWGQPEEIYHFHPLCDSLEDRDVVWQYANGTELSFSSSDNFVLGTISVSSVDTELEGKAVIGKSILELKLMFPGLELDDDFDEFGQDYILPELDVSLWVVAGKVDSISMYPDYDEHGSMKVNQQLIEQGG
ncbi:hypothetical protein [uncultured Alteromonas sp.]|uniref:hypothetical protein n=1 Tax=uncultured Alteromonas sp. TaxID=179113 RepID=UPI0025F60EAB|nr:hypothetical protein [uncultured Alteromonas sp.]